MAEFPLRCLPRFDTEVRRAVKPVAVVLIRNPLPLMPRSHVLPAGEIFFGKTIPFLKRSWQELPTATKGS